MNTAYYQPNQLPSEAQLLAEIASHEREVKRLGRKGGLCATGIQLAYRIHTKYRRQLLAAMRAGRSHAWTEYEPAKGPR